MKIILLVAIGCFFLGCQKEVETNLQNLEMFFNKEKLTLIEEGRVSLGAITKKKFEFIQKDDSIKVVISDVEIISNSPRTITISKSDFEEIKRGLRCIATHHIEREIPISGTIISSLNQYFIQTSMKKMRLFDSESDCDFQEILSKKLSYPDLLDLIDEFG